MNTKAILLALSMLLISLAGCADSAPVEEDDGYDGIITGPTDDDRGVIRGVVVDDTIAPLAGASVAIEGQEGKATTSNEEGRFAFANVEPGFVQLLVDMDGYGEVRMQVSVEAGVKTPAIIQVQLYPDPSELPFVQPLTFNGYLDCSISSPAYRVAVCSLPGLDMVFDDNFMTTYSGLGPNPDYIQSEMIWESTSPAGDAMMMTLEADVLDGGEIGDDAQGLSPLIIKSDKERINASRFSDTIIQRVFNYEYPGTAPPVPVCGVPNPIHGGTMCVKGVGATLQQKFDIYTHVFYRTAPSADWQFSTHGSPE